ncbi:hypothetical protein [Endozoicomonas sp. Mp262]|uniref:hypothetical protein n=1 Tax=Endozoicomonas sp. Mp262 TaxID=2919499 RepID=UPI0021D97893
MAYSANGKRKHEESLKSHHPKKAKHNHQSLPSPSYQGIAYFKNSKFPHSESSVKSYILAARVAEQTCTQNCELHDLKIGSIKFTDDDRGILRKQTTRGSTPAISDLTVIMATKWDSAFLTAYVSVKSGANRGVSTVIAGGKQFGGGWRNTTPDHFWY